MNPAGNVEPSQTGPPNSVAGHSRHRRSALWPKVARQAEPDVLRSSEGEPRLDRRAQEVAGYVAGCSEDADR